MNDAENAPRKAIHALGVRCSTGSERDGAGRFGEVVIRVPPQRQHDGDDGQGKEHAASEQVRPVTAQRVHGHEPAKRLEGKQRKRDNLVASTDKTHGTAREQQVNWQPARTNGIEWGIVATLPFNTRSARSHQKTDWPAVRVPKRHVHTLRVGITPEGDTMGVWGPSGVSRVREAGDSSDSFIATRPAVATSLALPRAAEPSSVALPWAALPSSVALL